MRAVFFTVAASLAVLVTADDGESPVLRLEPGAVGLAPIGASASDEAVYRRLLDFEPQRHAADPGFR